MTKLEKVSLVLFIFGAAWFASAAARENWAMGVAAALYCVVYGLCFIYAGER